jgi:8-oxo-dGTP pyrophosphatase MutT (NUDIX family)
MYKVFFKDRTVFFKDDFPETFRTKNGLFYKFESLEALREIVFAYFHLEKINTFYLFHHDMIILQEGFSSLFKTVRASGGLVRNSKGEFLAIYRNGVWDLPKGKAEKGETSSETAIREVSEECGIHAPELGSFLLKTYHAYLLNGKPILKETDWYNMTVDAEVNTNPQENENITEVRWINSHDISMIKSNTYPLILDVLAEAGIS